VLLLLQTAACQAQLQPFKCALATVADAAVLVKESLAVLLLYAAAVEGCYQAYCHLLATICHQESCADVALEQASAAGKALCAWCLRCAVHLLQHTSILRAKELVPMCWGVGDALLPAAPGEERAELAAYMGRWGA
jgi:hypothetical protein